MKLPKTSLIISLLASALLLQLPAQAQHRLMKCVLGNGGAFITSANHQSQGTLGQALTGRISSPSYLSQVGYWYAPSVPSGVTWQANISLSDAGAATGTLTFGQAPTATERLDPALDEKEMPPVPPSGVFDARFVLPGTPIIGSLKDFRPDADDELTWTLRFQPGPAGFPMTLHWNSAELPSGNMLLKDAITGTIINVNMKSQSELGVTNSAITSLLIEMTTEMTRTVNVVADWNIISVPLHASDMRASALFPGAASEAFRFDNGYVAESMLANGIGYWLKFTSPRSYQIQGMEVSPKTVPVRAGWNIIGLFESEVPTAAISTQPPGIVASEYFEFSNGYRSVATLAVGKGYWVKANAAGTLLLPSGSAAGKRAGATTVDEMSTRPAIRVEDSRGEVRMLYLATAKAGQTYELPPVPPAGILDVRYGSGQYVESLSASQWEVCLSSAHYPITIKAENLSTMALGVEDAVREAGLKETLTDGKEIIVANSSGRLLMRVEEASPAPLSYELGQNYPNPFNPSAVIKYALPEAARVKISVYNLLGERVTDLVEADLPAGRHQVEVNVQSFTSGVYFYVMEAGSFRMVRKMVIAK